MPGLLSSVQRFDIATGIPEDVWNALRANAARANVILPHAEKIFGLQDFTPTIDAPEQFWLVYSQPGTSDIIYILSCTEGLPGKYPLFLLPTVPITDLTPEFLKSPMKALCNTLLNEPDFRKQRVFSVFSVKPFADAFALAWEELAEMSRIKDPYYDAIFMTCSKNTLEPLDLPEPQQECVLRLADEQDAETIGVLCREFAATSVCLLHSLLERAFMDENP